MASLLLLGLTGPGHAVALVSALPLLGAYVFSTKSIVTHRSQIMDKLEMRSIAELTKFAIREGLTRLE